MADTGLIPIFTTQFSQRLDMKLQQQGSKLRGRVDVATGYVGKNVSPMQQIGAIASRAPVGRFAPKTNTVQDYTRRWLFPQDRAIDQYFDNFDQLRTIVEPKSKSVENAANACGRDWDDEIIRAATADASIGADAASFTTETFNTTNFRVADTFGSSASTGMTIAKIIEGRRILRHYENDLENDQMTLLIGSKQESELLNQIQVTSKDYNKDVAGSAVLVDGRLTRLLNADIVVSERVTQTTASVMRGCLLFVKSGIHLGIWQDVKTQIFQRPDLEGNPWDVSTVHTFGATRTQPGKVIQILCADTTGVAINA